MRLPAVQVTPSDGSIGRPLGPSGQAQTRVPPGAGRQKWLHPPLFTEQGVDTEIQKARQVNE